MDLENLKKKLEETGCDNLFVNRGQNSEYIEKIRRKFKIDQNIEIIGVIDADNEKKGDEGVLITPVGIQWVLQVKVEEKDVHKGVLTFDRLSDYSCTANKKFVQNVVTLKRCNLGDGENLIIKMPFYRNSELTDEASEFQLQALEKLFQTLIDVSDEGKKEIPDEKNGRLIEVFIDDEDAFFYKKAFAKYSMNNLDKFAFCFSWGGFFFGFFNLFHRKLYLESLIWLVLGAVLSGISSGILSIVLFFAGAFVNPFLVYKRYKKILAQCNSQKMTYEQKTETLKVMGGMNPITNFIVGIFSLLLGLAIILILIMVIVRVIFY